MFGFPGLLRLGSGLRFVSGFRLFSWWCTWPTRHTASLQRKQKSNERHTLPTHNISVSGDDPVPKPPLSKTPHKRLGDTSHPQARRPPPETRSRRDGPKLHALEKAPSHVSRYLNAAFELQQPLEPICLRI